MHSYLRVSWKILSSFRDYRPQAITPISVWRWLRQFPRASRKNLFLLLDQIVFYSEVETAQVLRSLNQQILDKLHADGIGLDHIIYVALDSPGSSSHVMLSMLRDSENLERKKARLVDSHDERRLSSYTTEIGTGAIIYIDDFAGTGKQFLRNRNWVAQFISGAFSEFFLVPVLCEEARQRIEDTGVVPVAGLIHEMDQRPLHRETTTLPDDCKRNLVELCERINPHAGLGFGKLATMVVFYRNAPNTMPLVFRGSLEQTPYAGIFPRTDDLPF